MAENPNHSPAIPPDLLRPPKLRRALPRIVVRLIVIVAIVTVLHFALGWVMGQVSSLNSMSGQAAARTLIIIALIGYAILITIPFMPGIEVGIALLMLEGATIAPFVYLATVTGLFLSYLIGGRVPLDWLHRAFRDLHMMRACQLIHTIKTRPAADRLNSLNDRLPRWLARLTVDYRYVSIGLLLNIPGTFAIGGGGGILMLAGIARLFNPWGILLTLTLATLPVPLLVWFFGTDFVI